MRNNKITIVIPTRERAKTLLHAIETCVTQKFDNLTILISDNASQDNTRDVVESFKDKRIEYYNTGTRVSMSHNWEFALSKIDSGFVCVIGDDDGMLPNAVSDIDEILHTSALPALNWYNDMYLWPDYGVPERANELWIHDNKGEFRVMHGPTELKKIFKAEQGYGYVPWLYKALVSIDAVKAVKAKTGTFFHSMIPDVYSGIALSTVIDTYGYSMKPFTLNAVSGYSNGASFALDEKSKAAQMFLNEGNIPYHPKAVYCKAGFLTMLESLFKILDNKLVSPDFAEIDYVKHFEGGLKEVEHSTPERYKDVELAIHEMAIRNGISGENYEGIFKKHPNKPFTNKHEYTIEGYNYFKKRLEINAATYGVSNVYQASLLHEKIQADRQHYLKLLSLLKSNFLFAIRELKKRYL